MLSERVKVKQGGAEEDRPRAGSVTELKINTVRPKKTN